MLRALLNVLFLALLISGSAAGATGAIAGDDYGRTPMPHPPRGKGEHCVADTAFMRRNHMNMLLHHRTEEVRLGVRTEQYDLNRCVSCHAVLGTDGKPVTYANSKHFCRSCHDYAAVSLDCFECHASRPAEPSKMAATSAEDKDKDLAALADYLREAKP
ncbi:MAG: hypothetical protein ACLQIQ_12480 [Beijerinckiaceae bacterium]